MKKIFRFVAVAALVFVTRVAFSDEAKSASQPFPGKVNEWEHFARHDFEVDGAKVIVVEPKTAAPGRPWLWRA